MKNRWSDALLDNLLVKSDDWIGLDPTTTYREVTVRLWGLGVVLRREVLGDRIKTSRRLRVHRDQFILSRIDARNGAFGLIPEELDDAVVSNDFPVFDVRKDRLLPEFLGWMSKTKNFVDLCRAASEGTTNRVRLKEDRFLQMTISLPPLSEQRRIVAKIEQLAAKIADAHGLRRTSRQNLEALWPNTLRQILVGRYVDYPPTGRETAENLLRRLAEKYRDKATSKSNNAHPSRPAQLRNGPQRLPKGWRWTTLGSVLTHLVDCINDTPDFADHDTGLLGLKSSNVKPYAFDLTDRWFMKPDDFAYWNRRERPQAGDILLTREAPMGQACQLPDGFDVCLTQRLMLMRTDPEFLLPEFLLHFLNSPHFREQVQDMCRGLTTPHIRVKDAPHFLLPLPPLEEQRRIVDYLDSLQAKVDRLKDLQAKTAAELDALLPSIIDKAFKGEL